MSLLSQAMRYYPYVFHPITVLGVSILVLIHHEWARQGASRGMLRRRVVAFLVVGLLALLPTVAFFLISGSGVFQATQGNGWQMDSLVASGLFIASAVNWVVWRHYEWGPLIPEMMVTLAAVTVPYVALSPFWNVSGHVIIALMPTLYLTLVNRKFWPLLAVPIVMVPNRIYLEAHTWPQTLGGFAIAAVITAGLYWIQAGGSLRTDPEQATL